MNRKIIDTALILSKRAEEMPLNINQYLQSDSRWQPYGNIFKDEDNWFCLLMVKYE